MTAAVRNITVGDYSPIDEEVDIQTLMRRARIIVLDAMNSPLQEWSEGDDRRVALAVWVLKRFG